MSGPALSVEFSMPRLAQMRARLDGLSERIVGGVTRLAVRAGQEAAGEARAYFAGNTKGDAPGRWGLRPHTRSARLKQSITTTASAIGGDTVVKVGTNVQYAPFVEFGTRRSRPHPYLTQAFEEAILRFRSRIDAMISAELLKVKEA
jgi:HK97 gp10 family phage protein